ncbi:Neurokinin receptor,G protein-coupled receptor, rhodopsin-like,GPCR, rhodopsin-like, 7TM [Cinara cedri]|uniref:Neurokinin receptor,G protein-coupled receptor, rhodopsin-like,GPCR, rhodopsin-like, 7TM n=1 Tax=Cinara cedri TaxID=506608 RepID=A0A5E4M8X0_9HEMI|nr:Neurokinin receptor,G protein-coupled receptor, rhodopsin-like,GPCR, rhodopsin-like, 7TM [Cinara cedri]
MDVTYFNDTVDTWAANRTYNGTWPDSNQFELSWWHQLAWTALFVPMITVATGGNLIVIWIVMTNKRMRNVTNYFLVNLSIADAMVSTLNVSVNFSYMLTSNWSFGTAYCKISQFVAVLSICASVFTLMAISIDRYIAIIHPLRPRLGRKTTLMIAVSIWVVGTILSIPNLIFFTTYTEQFPNGEQRVICYAEWPDGITTESFQEYVYNVSFMIITYFVPIGLMGFTYAMIGHELWGSQSIGECTQRQLEHVQSKRRVVKMMIVVVTIFAICWLPYHIYFIVTSHMPELTTEPYIQDVYLAFYWLAMSNSMHNPIVYCWMNSRFRQGFKQFFSFVPCINVRTGSLIRREVVTSRHRLHTFEPPVRQRQRRRWSPESTSGPLETGEKTSRLRQQRWRSQQLQQQRSQQRNHGAGDFNGGDGDGFGTGTGGDSCRGGEHDDHLQQQQLRQHQQWHPEERPARRKCKFRLLTAATLSRGSAAGSPVWKRGTPGAGQRRRTKRPPFDDDERPRYYSEGCYGDTSNGGGDSPTDLDMMTGIVTSVVTCTSSA